MLNMFSNRYWNIVSFSLNNYHTFLTGKNEDVTAGEMTSLAEKDGSDSTGSALGIWAGLILLVLLIGGLIVAIKCKVSFKKGMSKN